MYAGILPSGLGPSAEQTAVLDASVAGRNILCRAVAGAGKTTTLLLLAARSPGRRHLLLTYNKRLQLEVCERAQRAIRARVELGHPPGCPVDVRTYHSAAGGAYETVVRNDEDFRRAVAAAPACPQRFDVLLLDEAQDMQVEYYAFVRHLLAANPTAQVVVVGDELQTINEYRGAHPGFLTEAAAIFETRRAASDAVADAANLTTSDADADADASTASDLGTDAGGVAADLTTSDTGAAANTHVAAHAHIAAAHRPWVSCRLSVSYRLTRATAQFVNTQLYNSPVLVGGNCRDPDRKPEYHACAPSQMVPTLARVVREAVAEFGPENVFVLAASVRNLATSRSPVGKLVRHHLLDVPTYVAGGDDEAVDDRLLRGKLAILSFNAVKGCERPCVVVVGLDEEYFKYYARDWKDPARVPNVLTVAATRASRLLVVVAGRRALRTVDAESLPTQATVSGSLAPFRGAAPAGPGPRRTVSVTDLVRHTHPAVVRAALRLLSVAEAADDLDRDHSPLADRATFGAFSEFVGNINGLVVPVLAEVGRSGDSRFAVGVDQPTVVATQTAFLAAVAADPFGFYITAAEHASIPAEFWAGLSRALSGPAAGREVVEWVILAIAVQAFSGGRYHVARQIADYSWVNAAGFRTLSAVVQRRLGDAASGRFEVVLPRARLARLDVVGRADYVEDTSNVVWEFKLGALCEEDVLQLGCYLALLGGGSGVLMSLRQPESRHVVVGPENAARLLEVLSSPPPDQPARVLDIIADFDAATAAADDSIGDSIGDSTGDADGSDSDGFGFGADF